MKPDYIIALEELMGPVDIRDDAPLCTSDCKSLQRYYHSEPAADHIGGLISNKASEAHTV